MASPLTRARARTRAFRHQRRAHGHGRTPFTVPVVAPTVALGPEHERIYWHPGRFGIRHAPEDVLIRLRRDVHPDLDVTWSPIHERWLVWVKEPRMQNRLCPGWALVFALEHPDTRAYLSLHVPLLVQNLFLLMRAKVGAAKAFFDRRQQEIDQAAASRAATVTDQRHALQREIRKTWRISNLGPGNKFALHHDGTIVPSRGELNWYQERLRHATPPEILQRMARDRDRLRAAGVIL